MSGDGFKFDFSPLVEGKKSSSTTAGFDAQRRLTEDANDIVAKLVDRSEKSSAACTFINASSKILSVKDVDGNAGEKPMRLCNEMKPHLRFHSSESIELHSIDNGLAPLRYVLPKHALSDNTTDLIPGVYEGGLKVWECSVDLCRFLSGAIGELSADAASPATGGDGGRLLEALRRSLGRGGSVMELGCGHGLPGCLILRENVRRTPDRNRVGASDDALVLFSDFNDFVLHRATIPNARMNVRGLQREDGMAMDEVGTASALAGRSIFAGGDWMGLSQRLWSGDLPLRREKEEKRGFRLDLILASETTYTPESCRDTAFLMLRHLKIDIGVGVVATKRFYFGVGGGTDSFEAACETLSACSREPYSRLRLCVRTVQSFDTGNANIRDIILVTCKRK